MRLFLNILLILISLVACYIEDIYLFFLPPQPGKIAALTLRCYQPFNFDQQKALGEKRKRAVSQYVPLYSYVPDTADAVRVKMEALMQEITELQGQKQSGRELAKYIQSEFGVEVPWETAAKLLWYPNVAKLIDGVLTIEESILQRSIVEDPLPLEGKAAIDVLYPAPAGIVVYPVDDVITLEDAKTILGSKIRQLFWQIDEELLDPVVRTALAVIVPNLQYDQEENDRRIEEIIQRYPSEVIPFESGEILVPFQKVLDERDVLLLTAYQNEKHSFLKTGSNMLIILVFSIVLYNLFLLKILTPLVRNGPPVGLHVFMLILNTFFMKACLVFIPAPVYVLPMAILPLLLVLLNQERVTAVFTTLMAATLVVLCAVRTFDILLFYSFGGLVAILASASVQKRMHILILALALGGINAFFVMFISVDWGNAVPLSGFDTLLDAFSPQALGTIGWAFAGGVFAGPLALLSLPFLHLSRHTASTFKLNRYTDLQHPLLRDLLTKTPGTYQHTMSVAHFAQSVAESIRGVNTLILRIGAYYHDIGKMVYPKLFVENQFGGKNPHDDLDPQKSTKIIVDHVKNGRKLAQDAGLPDVVIDLIEQHHGTQLIEFFYEKSVRNRGKVLPEKAFRYPGPKPQTIEAAILMIVDAVEAASRSIREPTRDKIEKMVRHLIEKRIADGQFDECDLSTRDFAQIVKALVDSIEAAFHSRVVYPWQEEQKG